MSHVSGRTYRVTLRLRSSSTGTLTLAGQRLRRGLGLRQLDLALPLH